eukprot:m.251776 g.251776  ORF g.251776 m.251776 type:complete len:897 (+) comp17523_c0_seq34:174-2864(+)
MFELVVVILCLAASAAFAEPWAFPPEGVIATEDGFYQGRVDRTRTVWIDNVRTDDNETQSLNVSQVVGPDVSLLTPAATPWDYLLVVKFHATFMVYFSVTSVNSASIHIINADGSAHSCDTTILKGVSSTVLSPNLLSTSDSSVLLVPTDDFQSESCNVHLYNSNCTMTQHLSPIRCGFKFDRPSQTTTTIGDFLFGKSQGVIQKLDLTTLHSEEMAVGNFTPDGRLVVAMSSRWFVTRTTDLDDRGAASTLLFVPLTSNTTHRSLWDHANQCQQDVWPGDGDIRHMAMCGSDGDILVYVIESKRAPNKVKLSAFPKLIVRILKLDGQRITHYFDIDPMSTPSITSGTDTYIACNSKALTVVLTGLSPATSTYHFSDLSSSWSAYPPSDMTVPGTGSCTTATIATSTTSTPTTTTTSLATSPSANTLSTTTSHTPSVTTSSTPTSITHSPSTFNSTTTLFSSTTAAITSSVTTATTTISSTAASDSTIPTVTTTTLPTVTTTTLTSTMVPATTDSTTTTAATSLPSTTQTTTFLSTSMSASSPGSSQTMSPSLSSSSSATSSNRPPEPQKHTSSSPASAANITSSPMIAHSTPARSSSSSDKTSVTGSTSTRPIPQSEPVVVQDNNSLAIVLSAVFGAALILAAVLAWCWWRRHRRQQRQLIYELSPIQSDDKTPLVFQDQRPKLQVDQYPSVSNSIFDELQEAVAAGDVFGIDTCLLGGDVDLEDCEAQLDLIATACRYHQAASLSALLGRLGANFTTDWHWDTAGYTPAHWACAVNASQCIEVLLEWNPLVFAALTRDGLSCYHICIDNMNLEALQLLCHDDSPELLCRLFHPHPITLEFPLEYARSHGSDDLVKVVDCTLQQAKCSSTEPLLKAKKRIMSSVSMRKMRREKRV